MKLYLEQRIFSWVDKFSAYDEGGGELFYIEGEFLSLSKRLHVIDNYGNEAACIERELLTFLPRYHILTYGISSIEVVKQFTLFNQSYIINGPDWVAEGDFFNHEYTIYKNNDVVASISKQWFVLGDAYEIDIADGIDPVAVLAVVLVIDACNDRRR